MTFQRELGGICCLAFVGTIVIWRFADTLAYPLRLLATYLVLALGQILCLLFFTIFFKPQISRLRHIPVAPQAPLHRRLFKEPNAFHFEKWINEVPNEGFIRYFGMLNLERVLLNSSIAVREVMDLKAYAFEKPYSHKTHLKRISGDSLIIVEGNSHKFQRKVLTPAFWFRSVPEQYYPIFWVKASELADTIQAPTQAHPCSSHHSLSAPSTWTTLVFDELTSRTIYDIIGMAPFNFDFKYLREDNFFRKPSLKYRDAFSPAAAAKTRVILVLYAPYQLNLNQSGGTLLDLSGFLLLPLENTIFFTEPGLRNNIASVNA